jgi:DNA replication initiation complex subunit (GINS family)
MDSNTVLTVGFVVLVAAALFVTARAGAVAVGLLPPARGIDDGTREARDSDESTVVEADESGPVETDGSVSAEGDDTGRSRLTAADHERIRSHLEKDRFHRRPDDLLPSEDDGS